VRRFINPQSHFNTLNFILIIKLATAHQKYLYLSPEIIQSSSQEEANKRLLNCAKGTMPFQLTATYDG
jgi:hypothetical protein